MKSTVIFILLVLLDIIVFSQDTSKSKSLNNLIQINVTVVNEQNVSRPNDIIIFQSVKNKKIYSGKTDVQGKYSLLLPKADSFIVKYKDFTDTMNYSGFATPANATGGNLTIQIETQKKYVLNNIFFDTGLSTLKPSSNKTLNDLVDVMKLKPTLIIEIAGHTDNTGTPEINKKLSQSRADAVKNYLIKKGVAANRITAKGYGDTEAVADNKTEAGKAKNRRTEVRIIKE